MAVNCWLAPSDTKGRDGVSAIETRVAGVTVNVAMPLMVPEVALIVVVPAATPLASPPLVIVAMFMAEELQVAEPLRFCVLPSV